VGAPFWEGGIIHPGQGFADFRKNNFQAFILSRI